MLKVVTTKKFEKEVEIAKKRGKDMTKLGEIIRIASKYFFKSWLNVKKCLFQTLHNCDNGSIAKSFFAFRLI